MSQRFSYIKYDEASQTKQQRLKAAFEFVEKEVEAALPGQSRPKALVLTHLEEAYMWTGKGIRDEQIARSKQCEEQPERGNE